MIVDKHTILYKLIYGVVMVLMFFVLVSGAIWVAKQPFVSLAYINSVVKIPLYKAELYREEGGLMSLLTSSRDTVFADTSNAASVPILVYHGITKEHEASNIDITVERFKEQMFALRKAGYTTIRIEELHAFIHGERALPPRPIMITFDDGRTDSYYNGNPVLSAVGYNAVMYAIGMFTEPRVGAGGGYYLSDEEVAMLAESDRWEIGSHSYNGHRQVPQNADGSEQIDFYEGLMWLPDQNRRETLDEFRTRISEDMRESREMLEEITGQSIPSLSFPFGNYAQSEGDDAEIREIVLTEAERYYDLLFYQSSPHQYFSQAYIARNEENKEQVLVRRITMTNDIDGAELLEMLSHGTAKGIPFIAAMEAKDGWVNAWGGEYLIDGELILDGEGSVSGAATMLDGTRHWTDYRVDASVTSSDSSNVVLMVRHDSQGDTVACNYGRDFVHINQRLGGVERVIRGVDGIDVLRSSSTIQIAAEVEGRNMRCYLNGEMIVETAFLDSSLGRGGVGLKTWKDGQNAHIVIHSFSVSPVTEEAEES